MTTIAVMGLGAMGSRMTENLLKAGHRVVVYNRNWGRADPLVKRGAELAATPREAASKADIVMSMVTDDEASKSLWRGNDGALAGLRDGAVALESSTLTPAWVRVLGELVRDAGGELLDAPVAGSRPQAEAGKLIFIVGGSPEALERVRPFLDAMGGAVRHVGPAGAGATMKLAVNALFAIQVAALSEIVAMLERSGFERGSALEALGGMPITSPALKGVGSLIAAREYAPMFPIDLVEKDLRYAQVTTESLGSTAPMTASARDVYQGASKKGFGGDNIAGIAQLYD